MIKEVHPIHALIRVPVAAVPSLVVQGFLDLVQPFLRAVIHGGLVNRGQEHFGRCVLAGTGMGENDVHLMGP